VDLQILFLVHTQVTLSPPVNKM